MFQKLATYCVEIFEETWKYMGNFSKYFFQIWKDESEYHLAFGKQVSDAVIINHLG